jgi:hypothetical protein
MLCAETLRVQAHFDDELDALAVEDIERHSHACAACRALVQDLRSSAPRAASGSE